MSGLTQAFCICAHCWTLPDFILSSQPLSAGRSVIATSNLRVRCIIKQNCTLISKAMSLLKAWLLKVMALLELCVSYSSGSS